jgi:hypothetical protein
MSKIKDLKTNPGNSVNIVEVLELFSPDSKSKYTDLLLRMMKNTPNLKEHTKEIKEVFKNQFPFMDIEKLSLMSDIQIMLIFKFIDGFFNVEDLQRFRKFCEYNERGLVEQSDLTKYKSLEEIISSMSIAEMKAEEKELENQVIKIHEDTEWLLLRPLTFNASKKYGANTKWCTTTEHNNEYFHKYSKRGVLIYCINKKTGYKVASFYSLDKNEPEFSYWNQKDTRIDSTESNLTLELIGLIRDYVKDKEVKTNHFMFEKSNGFAESNEPKSKTKSRSARIADAIRREQETDVEEVMEQPTEPEEINMLEVEAPRSQSIVDRMRILSDTPEIESHPTPMWESTSTQSESEAE